MAMPAGGVILRPCITLNLATNRTLNTQPVPVPVVAPAPAMYPRSRIVNA